MRSVSFFALALLAACSAQPPAAEHGALWPHRERIVEALTFRTGALSSTVGKKARPCFQYWINGDPDEARRSPAVCDAYAREVQDRFEDYLGVEVSAADVRDPALWRYVAERAKL